MMSRHFEGTLKNLVEKVYKSEIDLRERVLLEIVSQGSSIDLIQTGYLRGVPFAYCRVTCRGFGIKNSLRTNLNQHLWEADHYGGENWISVSLTAEPIMFDRELGEFKWVA